MGSYLTHTERPIRSGTCLDGMAEFQVTATPYPHLLNIRFVDPITKKPYNAEINGHQLLCEENSPQCILIAPSKGFYCIEPSKVYKFTCDGHIFEIKT